MKTRAAIVKDARRLRSGSLSPGKFEHLRKETPSPRTAKSNKQVTGRATNTDVRSEQGKASPAKKDLFTTFERDNEIGSHAACSTVDVTTTCKKMVNESSGTTSNIAAGGDTNEMQMSQKDNGGSNTADSTMRPKATDNIRGICSDISKPSCSGVRIKLKKPRKSKLRITAKVLGVKHLSTKRSGSSRTTKGKASSAHGEAAKTPSGQDDNSLSGKPEEGPQKVIEEESCKSNQPTEDELAISAVDKPGDSCQVHKALSDAFVSDNVLGKQIASHAKHAAVEAEPSETVPGEGSTENSRLDHAEVLEQHLDVQNPSSPANKNAGTVVCEEKDRIAEGTVEDIPNSTGAALIEGERDIETQDYKKCEAGSGTVAQHQAEEQVCVTHGNKQAIDAELEDNMQSPTDTTLEQASTSSQGRKKKRPRRKASEKNYQSTTNSPSGSSKDGKRGLRKPAQRKGSTRRVLPARQCSLTQTSLDSFVARKPDGESSDSTAASWQADSEDDVSSSLSSLDVPQPPTKKRRLTDKERLARNMVERRDVATQCVTDGSSTNIWFEFYEAEPKERSKMIKRNHFTQTNARMIATLDYKKCEAQPKSTRKYYCGMTACQFKGIPSEIIAHVKARHVGYKVLVCKCCKKKHASLALFVCHLGSRSCVGSREDDKNDEEGSSSGGEDDVVEVGSDDEVAPKTVAARQVNVEQDPTGVVKSPTFDSRHVLVVLTERFEFLHGTLLPQNSPLFSLREVAELLKAGTTYSKFLFRLSPLVDVNFLCTLYNGVIKMSVLRSHPHAVYRKAAPVLDTNKKAALSSLLQRMQGQLGYITKSVIKALVFAATSFAPITKGICAPSDMPALSDPVELESDMPAVPVPIELESDKPSVPEPIEIESDKSDTPPVPEPIELKSGTPALPVPIEIESETPPVPEPIELKSGTPALPVPIELESDTPAVPVPIELDPENNVVVSVLPQVTSSGLLLTKIPATAGQVLSTSEPVVCQPVLPSTSSQPAFPSPVLQTPSETSYAIPMVVDRNVQSCLVMTPTKELNQMLQPLVTENFPNMGSVSGQNSNLLQCHDGGGKFPKLAPKISSPYALQSVIRKLEGGKVQGQNLALPLMSKSKVAVTDQLGAPAHRNPLPQPLFNVSSFASSISPGYIFTGSPSSMPVSTGYIFSGMPPSTSASAGSISCITTPSSSHLSGTLSVQRPNIFMMALQTPLIGDAPANLHQADATHKKIQQQGCLQSASKPSETSVQCQDTPIKKKEDNPSILESQSATKTPCQASPLSMLKYRDAFQSALERAMRYSETQVKKPNRDVPEVPKPISPSSYVVTNVFLCECSFQATSKTTLEEHIRSTHILERHGCRICSISFPGLKQLENHFLQHVKIVSTQLESVHRQKPLPLVSRDSKDAGAKCSTASESNTPYQKVTAEVARLGETEPVRSSCVASPSLLVDLDKAQEPKDSGKQLGTTTSSESTRNSKQESTKSPALSKKPSEPSIKEVSSPHTVDVIEISDLSDEETTRPKILESSVKPLYATLRPDLLGPEALKPFFKCIIDKCTFTATVVKEFAIHLASHPTSDLTSLLCMYCGQKFDVINEMVSHIASKHGRRVYQCGWCMYRTAAQPLLMLHLRFSHEGSEPVFYKCSHLDYSMDPSPDPIKPKDFCCGVKNCTFSSFSTQRFVRHYKTHHSGVKVFDCPNCDSQLRSIDSLIEHLVVHGFNTVQCAYCLCGTKTFQEMLKHVCDNHADCELNFLVRTQRERVKYKEFVGDASNRAIFFPEKISPQAEVSKAADTSSEVLKETGSTKPCPFCEKSVSSLSDMAQHCADEHKIALSISVILDLLLKKAKSGASAFVHLGCRFCSFKGADSNDLKAHLYQEFSYEPNAANHSEECSSQRNLDFEEWVLKLVDDSIKIPKKLTKPYACMQCKENFDSSNDLRVHLYSHKKYFPHHCGVCAESFTTEDEATEHQRLQHKMENSFLVEEVRFANVEQVIDEAIEVQINMIQDQMRNSESEHCIWNDCAYHSSERATLLRHMISMHLATHRTCSLCSFASYSEKVMKWHSKSHLSTSGGIPQTPPPAEVLVEAHSTPIPKPRGSFKCGYCKFRGDSSIAIREHAAKAHRGLPVKLVVPPRPMNDVLVPTFNHSVDSQARAAPQADRQLTPLDTPAKPPSVCSTSSLSEHTRSGPLCCKKCTFIAPSERILKIHHSNLHESDSDESEQSSSDEEVVPTRKFLGNVSVSTRDVHTGDESVSSTTLEFAQKVPGKIPSKQIPSKLPFKRKAISPTLVSSGPSSSGTKKSTAPAHKCAVCQMQFSNRNILCGHLKSKHHYYALCDYCEKPFMNKRQAMTHSEKVHPLLPIKYSVITREASSTCGDPDVGGVASQKGLEGFSWYRHPIEPLDMDKTFVLATVPGVGTPMRFCASTFFEIHRRRPVLRIKDFTKLF